MNTGYSQCQGDANLDNIVNILDVVLVVNHILDTDHLIDEGFDNSDLNADGGIDIIDIIIIIDILLTGDTECEQFYPIDLSLEWEFAEDLSYFDSEQLNDIINEMSNLAYLEGIIIVHNGEIVSENYYNGSSINQTFNIWSVTKSFTSTLIGQAIDQEYIDNQYLTLNNLLPISTQPYLSQISLHNLLSMSSGYADGFGYPYWVSATTTQLESMPYTFPGFFFYNNSACHLNSHVLYYATQMTPSEFANMNLFPYLGIENPQWLDGYLNINDASASLELRLRDMIKLGQLYLQDGWSGDEQILSSEWIEQATSIQVETNNSVNSGYGYLWWLPPGEGYMAIGYAGQYIAVYPERGLVIGAHSSINNDQIYQSQLLEYIHNQIAPIFDGE
jgi:CubicO group peptidase (beta-lactamase class C family)